MVIFIVVTLLATHAGAAYLGYKKGSQVAAVANQIKTDVQSLKKP